MDGKLEAPAQLLSKFSHLLRLRALLPAHAEWVAEHDFPDLILADGPLQPAKVGALVFALQRLQPLGGNAQRIRNSQAHAPAAVVDRQDASGNFHAAIIRGNASY